MRRPNKKSGISILGFVLFVGLIILALSYFHISIRGIVESPAGQENVNYVGGIGSNVWNKYLKKPTEYFWNDLWVPLWKNFTSSLNEATIKVKDNSQN